MRKAVPFTVMMSLLFTTMHSVYAQEPSGKDDKGLLSSDTAIGALIGAIAGSFTSFYFAYWIDKRKDKEFVTNANKLIAIELNQYYGFFDQILKKGVSLQTHSGSKKDLLLTRDSEIWEYFMHMISRELTYLQMSPETRIKALDFESLDAIEDVYNSIQTFNKEMTEIMNTPIIDLTGTVSSPLKRITLELEKRDIEALKDQTERGLNLVSF